MATTNKKAVIFKITGRVLGVIMLLMAICLAILAITFSFGEQASAPNLFGYNIYIVKNGSFDQLKANTAAVAQKVNPDEIYKNDIVVYREFDSSVASLAKINNASLKDAVFSYSIVNESGKETTISQGQIVGKVTSYSDFWGLIISFAMSPIGVFAIAIIPCLSILLFELIKFIFSKLPQPTVEPVKKQDESPTYVSQEISEKRKEIALNQQPKIQAKIEQEKILRKTSTPANSVPIHLNEPIKKPVHTQAIAEKPIDVKTVEDKITLSPEAVKYMNKSAEIKKPAPQLSKPSVDAGEKTPPKIVLGKTAAPQTARKETSAPDLNDVFREESDKRYDIDDILAGIEHKKNE